MGSYGWKKNAMETLIEEITADFLRNGLELYNLEVGVPAKADWFPESL